MDFGCPSRTPWIAGTIIFLLTTLVFLALWLLERFNWGGFFRKSTFNEPCQAGKCVEGLMCNLGPDGINGTCGTAGGAAAPPANPPPATA